MEKTLPSFDGFGNVYDFIEKLRLKLAAANVMDDQEKLTLLKSKLEGKAYTAARLHASEFTTFLTGLAFLKKQYAPTIAAIQAQLQQIAFKPK